jgi:hypothetical protein
VSDQETAPAPADDVAEPAALTAPYASLPAVGVAMWCERMRHVGEVVSVEGNRVRLSPLDGGRPWYSTTDDLRYARVVEIRSTLLARFYEGREAR